MSLRSRYWQLRFARWGRGAGSVGDAQPGYTLLLPVPGDLPVFLELALAVCRLQDPAYRVATAVIPDQPSRAISDALSAARPGWAGPLELLPLPAVDRVVLPRLGDPSRNHGAQLIRGVTRAASTHVLLHDADLFLMDPQVHAEEFRRASKDDLDVTGISPAWDPWFAERGRTLVATWEQCGRVGWFRGFPPHRHLGHDTVVDGEAHTFDTTFWPQLHTRPDRIALIPGMERRVVHFNYTISTYRRFARSADPFGDPQFRILLIRLFVELFATIDHPYGLPTLDQLAGQLGSPSARVVYSRADGESYRRMRADLGAVVAGPWSTPDRAARCQELLAAFDAYFG